MGKKRKECPGKEESLVQKTRQRVGAGKAAQLAEYLPGMNKSLDLIPSTE